MIRAAALRRGYGLAWTVLACILAPFATRAASLTATLDRSTISLGESATLSLTFTDGTPTRISGIQVPNLSVQSRGDRREISVVNGQMSSSRTFDYSLTPSQPGDYVIPSVQAEVDRQTLTTQPLTLRVTKAAAGSGLAFLKLIPSKDTVYVGETFPVEVQLFLATRQDSLQMPQVEGEGFVLGKMAQPSQSSTQIGNQIYTVGTFPLTAVAVKTGQLKLGPAQCSLVLHIQAARNRSLFDDVFGGGVQRRPITLTSEAQAINVLPLPAENRPAGFNGAIGDFSFNVSASPTNLLAGDPITLRLQVSGRGNLDALPFPGGTDWPDFKLYAPTSKSEMTDPIGMAGVKTFERVVIPQHFEIKEIPAIRFSFFDPAKKAYRTLEQPAIPIQVRSSQAQPPQPTVMADTKPADDASAPRRDIVHIKPYLGTVTPLRPPLASQPWFWALQCLPVVLWLSAWAWRKRRETLENNPRLRRRIAVGESVRNGLKNLTQLATAHESEAFFAAVFRLVQEQLGERLDLPASAITEAVLDERLRGRASEDLIDQLHHLFQLCNQVRYAPNKTTQELMAIVPQVETALRALRDLPDAAGVR
ncbi:MAG: BatD family protein [Verrucomicrobiota bacterium]